MSKIVSIGTALPQYRYQQSEISTYLDSADSENIKKLKLLSAKSGIHTRYSVLPDFSNEHQNTLFSEGHRNNTGLDARMDKYTAEAPLLAQRAAEATFIIGIPKEEITHIITVSCTGMYAPGLEIELVQKLGLREDIHRSGVNFMGCYAAIHALKSANAIANSEPDAIVLIICVELCTIHFQKPETADQMVANTLFADGAAGVLIISDDVALDKQLKGLEPVKFMAQLSPKGKNDMAWKISEKGFLMTLSSYIPQLIGEGIPALQNILSKLLKESQTISHWAIHPGGKKILEKIAESFQIHTKSMEPSYGVMGNYGNMSSPTVLFVLKEILENHSQQGDFTLAMAFGPGLTTETVLLKHV